MSAHAPLRTGSSSTQVMTISTSSWSEAVANLQFMRPLLWLLLGILMGSSFHSRSSSNKSSSLLALSVKYLDDRLESHLIPLYTLLVMLYLSVAVAFRRQLDPALEAFVQGKGLRGSVLNQNKPEVVQAERESVNETALAAAAAAGLDQSPEPINLSGAYQLISNDNFDGFLAVQGVNWALRSAANKARPTHRITQKGSILTIKIEGIIESQTTYVINGPPVETSVRGRIFEDKVTFLPSGKGIVVTKRAISENYDVTVERVLSDDKQEILMTSTATFRDGKDPVKCVQLFRRFE